MFGILLIGASYLLGQISAGQDVKIIKDLGLASIATFGLLIAVFIGVGLVWKEVEKRSIHTILSKPVGRAEFVIGKYCGLALTLLVNVSMMTLAFYAVLVYMGWQQPPELRAALPAPAADPRMLIAVALIFVELLIVTAIALFFSTFSSPFLSALFTLGLWTAGQFHSELENVETLSESPFTDGVTRALYYALPNFSAFDVKAPVVYGEAVGTGYVALTVLYGLTYVLFVLVGAVAVFARRDF
jgi:ABC-type transport system involved in multi-copper enzyme maturation permease subunit